MKINDTSFNLLFSYAYVGKGNSEILEYIEDKSINGDVDIMIDSGAFTRYGYEMKGSHQGDWITLDNYCKWLDVHGNNFHKYVMMDKIGDDVQSRKNYEEMLKRGYNPMYVWTTFDKDYDYLKYAIDNNPEICVAGGKNNDYFKQRFQQAYKISNGKADIHALAFFKFPMIYRLPIMSTDATSWLSAPHRWNSIFCYIGNGCYKRYDSIQDVLKGLKRHDKALIDSLKFANVTVQDFKNDYARGGYSLANYLSEIAILQVQDYAWRTKRLRVYLSGAQRMPILKSLDYIRTHLKEGGLNYREWKEYIK